MSDTGNRSKRALAVIQRVEKVLGYPLPDARARFLLNDELYVSLGVSVDHLTLGQMDALGAEFNTDSVEVAPDTNGGLMVLVLWFGGDWK